MQSAQAENSFGPFEATTGHGNQREVMGLSSLHLRGRQAAGREDSGRESLLAAHEPFGKFQPDDGPERKHGLSRRVRSVREPGL